jgi:hypothetical protein
VFTLTLPFAAPSATTVGSAELPQRKGGIRVLIIEDNEDAGDTMAELIELLGCDVDVAYDGQSALSRVIAILPDLVLCDLGLPGGYGRLRDSPRFAHGTAVAPHAPYRGFWIQPTTRKLSEDARVPEGMSTAFSEWLCTDVCQSPANLAINCGERTVRGPRADENFPRLCLGSTMTQIVQERFAHLAQQR